MGVGVGDSPGSDGAPGAWIKIGSLSAFPSNGKLVVEHDRGSIVLLRLATKIVAYRNVCPHQGGSVGSGPFDGGALVCPDHGWAFDAETGAHVQNSFVRLRPHDVAIRDGDLWVARDPRPVPARSNSPGGARSTESSGIEPVGGVSGRSKEDALGNVAVQLPSDSKPSAHEANERPPGGSGRWWRFGKRATR
jgi:nitrite reductase (NADH) small subunit